MSTSILRNKIDSYRKKYYLNAALRGALLFLIASLAILLTFSLLEHYFWFSSGIRTVLFLTSSLALTILILLSVFIPFAKYKGWIASNLDDNSIARHLGKHFPSIRDRLLNALQLEAITLDDQSLLVASIDAYTSDLRPIPFNTAISLRDNLKYGRYIALIMLSMAAFYLIYPTLYTYSTKRLLHFRQDYTKPAPFNFQFINQQAVVFTGEEHEIILMLEGNSIPERVYIKIGSREIPMLKQSPNQFTYNYNNVPKSASVRFTALDFSTAEYPLHVVDRSTVSEYVIFLDFPPHTGLDNKRIQNAGNLEVPEGTVITWNIKTQAANKVNIILNDSLTFPAETTDNQTYAAQLIARTPSSYDLVASNKYGRNQDKLSYKIEIVKDKQPSLLVNYYIDTVLYEYAIFSGTISDDYGISSTRLLTSVNDQSFGESITASGTKTNKSFYQKKNISSAWLENPSSKVSFRVVTTDNDGFNGGKSVYSEVFTLELPTSKDIDAKISKKANDAEQKMSAAADKASSITEQIEELQKRLRSKNKIDWQEEMLLKELLKQRAELEKSLKDLEDQLKDLSDTEEKFKEPSTKLKEQAKQLEKLMNDVLDEETRKMYDELQNLLQENSSSEEVQEQLSKISNQEKNMEQELERAIELFKRLKVETNLEQAAQQLDKLAKKQEELSNQTNKAEEMNSSLAKKQQEIAETYEEIKEKIKDAEQLNQELKQPEPLENLNDDLQELDRGMDEAQENLENSDLKKGADQQKKNSEKLKETSEKLSQMTANMEMEMITEDIGNLRNIVDNLLKLSFEQERLIDAFYDVKQVDPRFVELSQEQLKLKDDAEIVKDSLLALSERVAQLSTAITREVAEVNRNIDAALTNLRDRNRNKALSNQQFAMASINELALLLDVLLQQMQEAMASSMGKGKPKDGKGNSLPNMKQLQEQISQQIQDLDGTGQKGRKLSEQLAKTAAQQEMLRDKMNELRNALKGQPGGQEAGESLDDAIKLMEQNEQDLVNKRINQQLMNRQQDIMTRMLDAENAMEEQDFDDEREANSAKDTQRNLPKAFEDYLREREKELELLKTVPIGLNPFYKKEVNSYFRRLSTDN
jgi:hypothetical protein